MVDILVALTFAGCIYGIARASGCRPDYRRVAGWTAFAMFAIAAYTEASIAAAGTVTPRVGRLVPIMLFAVVMLRLGRKTDSEVGPAAGILSRTPAAGWIAHLRALLNRLELELDQTATDEQESRAVAEGF